MAIDYSLIGKRVATARKERGLTQDKLAEKADISNNYLSHIETSRSIPSLETLMNICDALDVTPDYLLLGTSDRQKDYLISDIEDKLNQCTDYEKRVIFNLIDIMVKERTKKV